MKIVTWNVNGLRSFGAIAWRKIFNDFDSADVICFQESKINSCILVIALLLDINVFINLQDLLFDPQTSGGLLISLAEDRAADLLAELHAAGVAVAACIGRVTGKGTGNIHVR